MITLTLLASAFAWGGWQGILLKIAIACVVLWGIQQLILWSGWTIPRPIVILVICLACILVIYWLFELFNALT